MYRIYFLMSCKNALRYKIKVSMVVIKLQLVEVLPLNFAPIGKWLLAVSTGGGRVGGGLSEWEGGRGKGGRGRLILIFDLFNTSACPRLSLTPSCPKLYFFTPLQFSINPPSPSQTISYQHFHLGWFGSNSLCPLLSLKGQFIYQLSKQNRKIVRTKWM